MATAVPTITILYASETGCSTDVARRMNRELRRLGFGTQLIVMDHFPIEKLPSQQYVLFICSTTGQGQVPENMNNFWNFLLRSDLPPTSLQRLRYSIFGLGDTAYPLYNAVARRLDKRLKSLGATEFSPIGLGDDQHSMGYDGGLILWQLDFLQSLVKELSQIVQTQPNSAVSKVLDLTQTALLSAQSSLADAPVAETPPPANMTTETAEPPKTDQSSATDAALPPSATPLPTRSKIDYLAFSSASVTVVSHETFMADELEMLGDSPDLALLIYKAIIYPCLAQLKPLLDQYLLNSQGSSGGEIDQKILDRLLDGLISPSDELIATILALFKGYVGNGIEYVPGTERAHQMELDWIKSSEEGKNDGQDLQPICHSYHQFPVEDIFSFERIYEVLLPFIAGEVTNATQTQNSQNGQNDQNDQNGQKPNSLSSSYKSLNVLSTTRLTAPDHYQDVNHIQYDLSPLLINKGSTQHQTASNSETTNSANTSQTLISLLKHPPYLPGDVLEVVPPAPNVLINSLLTLYQLHPNDLIFLAESSPTDPKPHKILTDGTPHYELYSKSDSLFDFLLGQMESQAEIDERIENGSQMAPTKSNLSSFSSSLSLRRFESFPLCIRAWELFTWYVNSNFTPQRHHFLLLAQQATNPSEKERLTDLCSASYASVLDSYCIRERRSITEVFGDFPSSLWPLYWLVELCDRTKPRQFSLSSAPAYGHIPGIESVPSFDWFTPHSKPFHIVSPGAQENQVGQNGKDQEKPVLTGALCLATVKYTTPFKRQKFGFCSSYLDYLARYSSGYVPGQNHSDYSCYHDVRDEGYTVNYPLRDDLAPTPSKTAKNQSAHQSDHTIPTHTQRIMAKVKPGSFRYDVEEYCRDQIPVLAIGPGTGIAAMHSIIEHRFAYAYYHAYITSTDTPMVQGESKAPSFWSLFANRLPANISSIKTLSQSSHFDQRHVLTTTSNIINHLGATTMGDDCNPEIKYSLLTTPPLTSQITSLTSNTSSNLHQFALLFGCRSSVGDHLYRDFFNLAANLGIVDQYHAVFSRNNTNTDLTSDLFTQVTDALEENRIGARQSLISSRELTVDSHDLKFGTIDKYVQDRLVSHPVLRYFLIGAVDIKYKTKPPVEEEGVDVSIDFDVPLAGGRIIVAGNAKKMPVDVNNIIVDIIWDHIKKEQSQKKPTEQQDPTLQNNAPSHLNTLPGGPEDLTRYTYTITRSDVKRYVNIMAKRGRYILECWM